MTINLRRIGSLICAAGMMLSTACGGATSELPRFARSQSQLDEMNRATAALIAPTLMSPGANTASQEPTGEDAEELMTMSYRIFCSGVFIADDLVLTAHHCVDDQHEQGLRIRVGTYQEYIDTQATFSRGRWHYFDIAAVDPGNDLALLRLSQDEPRNLNRGVMRIAREDPRNGEFVFAMGHPRGLGWTLTYGIVSQATRVGNAATPGNDDATIYVQSSAQAYFGNSGGPLFNTNNQVVGIVSRGGPWHIVLSIHSSVIRDFVCDSVREDEDCGNYMLSASRGSNHTRFHMRVAGRVR